MRFGVGYWSAAATRLRPRHHSVIYDELCDDAVRAEELGFADYWVAEHHFWYDGHVSAPLTALGAVAQATQRIGLGTGVLVLPLHDALRVAEMAATVDVISAGRMQLALGLGYRDDEYDGFGVSRRTRGRHIDQQLQLLDELWSTGACLAPAAGPWAGPISLNPRPTRRPPLLLGGYVPAVVRRAARHGAGLVFPPRMPIEEISRLTDVYHEAGRELGVDTSQAVIGTAVDFYVAETTPLAREVAFPRLVFYYGETVGLGMGRFRDEDGQRIGAERPELLRQHTRACVETAVVGGPDEVFEQLQRLERAGVNYIQLRLRYDSLPGEVIDRATTLFAEQVMPRFASVGGSAVNH
jgi:alkanesulfonate monooxygenase SsuD/methylene tetrahydromethanopterin reductase-like flavin-dependent oxidoreductase (luciferase family)